MSYVDSTLRYPRVFPDSGDFLCRPPSVWLASRRGGRTADASAGRAYRGCVDGGLVGGGRRSAPPVPRQQSPEPALPRQLPPFRDSMLRSQPSRDSNLPSATEIRNQHPVQQARDVAGIADSSNAALDDREPRGSYTHEARSARTWTPEAPTGAPRGQVARFPHRQRRPSDWDGIPRLLEQPRDHPRPCEMDLPVAERPMPNFPVAERPMPNFPVAERPMPNFPVARAPTPNFSVAGRPTHNFPVAGQHTHNSPVVRGAGRRPSVARSGPAGPAADDPHRRTTASDPGPHRNLGPVAIHRVADDAEAIARANDTDYGLNARVWVDQPRPCPAGGAAVLHAGPLGL